ncbi:hypothetical protein J6590_052704 [Homalodisca vitripennis]|nr:hypothetical protein J6590_052704 [Homalodisca vitripennis]
MKLINILGITRGRYFRQRWTDNTFHNVYGPKWITICFTGNHTMKTRKSDKERSMTSERKFPDCGLLTSKRPGAPTSNIKRRQDSMKVVKPLSPSVDVVGLAGSAHTKGGVRYTTYRITGFDGVACKTSSLQFIPFSRCPADIQKRAFYIPRQSKEKFLQPSACFNVIDGEL